MTPDTGLNGLDALTAEDFPSLPPLPVSRPNANLRRRGNPRM
jgi:hypothetical protein